MRFIIQKKWILIAAALIPVIAACGALLWLAPKLKARQSREFLKVAERYLSSGKTRDGLVSLKCSLRLMPNNPDALRLLARIQTSQGDPAALDSWNKLLATGKVKLEDIALFAEVAANQQDWELSDRLAQAAEFSGNKGLPHLIRAGLLHAKGEPAAIEVELRKAVEVDQTLLSKRALAKFLLSQRMNEERSKEIFEILQEISKLQNIYGVEALATGLTKGIVPTAEISSWIAAIRAHPNSAQRDLCLADYMEIKSGLAPQEVVVAKLKERVKQAPIEARLEAMKWLSQLNEYTVAADLLSPSDALKSQSAYIAWLDANSLAENWPVILKSFDDPSNTFQEDYIIRLYRGHAYFTAGRKDEAEALFQSVYEQTHGDREKFLRSLVFLNLARQQDIFERGLKELLTNDKKDGDVFRALLPSTILRRNSADTLRFYELVATSSPILLEDIAFQNDLNYLRILLGQSYSEEKAASLSQANPMDQSLRITHAFAAYKSGNPAEALKILEAYEPGIVGSTLLDHEKAVLAAIFNANARAEEAKLVARMVQPNQLSVQEIQLVQSQFQNTSQNRQPALENAGLGSPKPTKNSKK